MNRLPFEVELNTIEVLKTLSNANNKIGELKGILRLLPNPKILLNAITLGEAKDSSEIENIITTYDELYKEMVLENSNNLVAKEVINYRIAINFGFEKVKELGYINTNLIKEIQSIVENNSGGIRKLPGTIIKNIKTGEIVHTPPQSENEILEYMTNLEEYINIYDKYDPLIIMSVMHYQLEYIDPFYDGNGRTGRIINILYLVLKGKIDIPILYLSKYIINSKAEYYSLFRKVQEDKECIIEFIIYILKGIESMSEFTIRFIEEINNSIESTRLLLKEKTPKIYSNELLESLYCEFYTKNEFFQKQIGVSRTTATKYLKELEKEGFLVSEKIGKEVIYKNIALFNLIDNW